VSLVTKEQLKVTTEEVKAMTYGVSVSISFNVVDPSPYLDDELNINSRASFVQPKEYDTD
jgi:hypothetical protein